MPETIPFLIDAQVGEQPLTRADVQRLLDNTFALLREIETAVTNEPPHAVWRVGEEYRLPLVASPNGLDASTLMRVATAAQAAFGVETDTSAPTIHISAKARASIAAIRKIVEKLDELTIQVGDVPITVEPEPSDASIRERVPRVLSTVEGHLATISDRGTYIYARLVEQGTNRRVGCRFSTELKERVASLFGHTNVIVTGMVAYDADGAPMSIVDVESVEERPEGPPLESFIGSTPGLLGGLTFEQFVQEMRGDEHTG